MEESGGGGGRRSELGQGSICVMTDDDADEER